MERNEMLRRLEDMIDTTSLPEVLELIAEVCLEKAWHIQATYGDKELAALWRHDGRGIDALLDAARLYRIRHNQSL